MKKTTKIIGAVLGVLLVAALFTGAAAAAADTDVTTVTVDSASGAVGTTFELTIETGAVSPVTITYPAQLTGPATATTAKDDNDKFTATVTVTRVAKTDAAVTIKAKGPGQETAVGSEDLTVTLPVVVADGVTVDADDVAGVVGTTFVLTIETDGPTNGVKITYPRELSGSLYATTEYDEDEDAYLANVTVTRVAKTDAAVTISAKAPEQEDAVESDDLTVTAAGKLLGSFVAYVPYDATVYTEFEAGQTWYLLDDHYYPITSVAITTAADEDDNVYFKDIVEDGYYVESKSFKWSQTEGMTDGVVAFVKAPSIPAAGVEVLHDISSTTTPDWAHLYNISPVDSIVDLTIVNFVPKDVKYSLKGTPATADYAWLLVNVDTGDEKLVDNFVLVANTLSSGNYYLQPYLKGVLVKDAPKAYRYGPMFPFTVGAADDLKLVLSADEVIVGKSFYGIAYGLPGVTYTVTAPGSVSIPQQLDLTSKAKYDTKQTGKWPASQVSFEMPASGSFKISFKAEAKDEDAEINLDGPDNKNASDSIKITDGYITAKVVKNPLYVGDDIDFEGTASTDDKDLYFFIEGYNVPFTLITTDGTGAVGKAVTAKGEEWDKTIKYAYLKNSIKQQPDAGTYTFYISISNGQKNGQTDKDTVLDDTYVTIPVTLNQSFITLDTVPEYVAQGSKIVIEGTANSAESIMWYLFGNNYAATGVQKVKDDKFTVKIPATETAASKMAAGDYFFVAQHPMYDKKYNVAPYDGIEVIGGQNKIKGMKSGEGIFQQKFYVVKNEQAGVYGYDGTTGLQLVSGVTYANLTKVFDVDDRQTNNAAQALCDEIAKQSIDDMYAVAKFAVGEPRSVIDPIPSSVVKGENLTVTGTTFGHNDDNVIVEIKAATFTAQPKEEATSSTYITLITKIGEDGTWKVVADTSSLNYGEYSVVVKVDNAGTSDPAVFNVVKKGEPVPTQTAGPQPTGQPTTAPTQTPASPGFGILAALAGLGAVAVLLLRRQ